MIIITHKLSWLYQDATPLGALLLIALVAMAIALTTVLIVYFRKRQIRKALEQRVAELETLEEASRAIVASELDIMALCRLIADEAGKIIDTDTFQIGLFEEELYQILYWRIGGEDQDVPVTYDLKDSVGIISWVREQRLPLLIEDLHVEIARLPAEPHYVSRHPGRSAIYLPLVSGESTLGVMAAQHDQPRQFTQQDLQRLAILANQAAAGVANASLYEQARTRAADLEMISRISQQVNELQDMVEIIDHVVTLARDRLGFHPVNVLGMDAKTGEAVLQATSVPELAPGSVRLAPHEGVIGAAVAARQAVVVNDVNVDPRYIRHTGIAAFDGEATATQSEIAIPLLVDDEVIGVLDVQSDRIGGFSPREQTVLEALAGNVASALAKARQVSRQREQAWQATAQLQVVDAINQSDSLADLLPAIVRLIPLLVGVESCAILLRDREIDVYVPGAIYGVSADEEARFHSAELSVGMWGPLDALHIGHTEISSKRIPPWCEQIAPEGITLYPLLVHNSLLGALIAEEPPPMPRSAYVFDSGSKRQHELMASIVEQTARAIEREGLHAAQEEEAWVNTALLQVAEAVNSLFNLNEILGTIVRLVPMLVGVPSALLMTWNERERVFELGPSHGLRPTALSLLDEGIDFSQLELKEHDMGTLAETKAYTVLLPEPLNHIFETESAEIIPLHARGQMVGTLLVSSPSRSRPLTGRRVNILSGIAQQAAMAVVNDRLYKESAERERLEQEIAVARHIQSSLIPDSRPEIPGLEVAAYWRAARQVSGDFYDFLALPNNTYGFVIADVADKGIPAALFMALCRTIIRSVGFTRLTPGATLSRANDIIVHDTESDLFVTTFYTVWNPETRTLTYANGGHNPPMYVRSNGETTYFRADGIAMGIIEEMLFAEESVQLEPGDTVVLYTDGVNETMNADQNEFGLERLRDVITATQGQSAAAVCDAITNALDAFAGNAPQFDDTTFVVIQCR